MVGTGAAVELELPDARTLLNKMAQAFDFQRLGGDLQSREMKDLDALFKKVKGKRDKLIEAATRIRSGSRLSSSIHSLLQQHEDDEHVVAVGKLAMVYFTLAAEAQTAIAAEPRDPGEMPLRGTENWLFQLGRMVVDGVPRARADSCFDNLQIINFNSDRSIQHYMPWVLHNGFGMDVTEARAICAEKLRVLQPYGCAGQLEWQNGDAVVADWADTETKKLFTLAEGIKTPTEFLEDRHARAAVYGGLAKARRLVFLGFDFNPRDAGLLFDERLTNEPEVLIALRHNAASAAKTVQQVLATSAGIGEEKIAAMHTTNSWKLLRDYGALIES